jgi:hypothetical protein
VVAFLRAYPSHTIADVYAMPWYRFQLFLRRAFSQAPVEYAPPRNEADEATERVVAMAAWQTRRDARRQRQ